MCYHHLGEVVLHFVLITVERQNLFYFFFKYGTFQERHADLLTITTLFKSVEEITFL